MAFVLLPTLHHWLLHQERRFIPVVSNMQTRRSSALDRLARVAGSLGSGLSYLLVVCFVFWNCDMALARRMMVMWALGFFVTNYLKDLLLLPRPSVVSDSVAHVSREPASFGWPSAHAFSAASVPLYAVAQLYRLGSSDAAATPFDLAHALGGSGAADALASSGQSGVVTSVAACLAGLWCSAICVSRIYLGAHTPSGVVAGSVLGFALVFLWLEIGDAVDGAFTGLGGIRVAPMAQLALAPALVVAYPAPFKYTRSYPQAAAAVGACSGFILGASWVSWTLLLSPAGLTPDLMLPLLPLGGLAAPSSALSSSAEGTAAVSAGHAVLLSWPVLARFAVGSSMVLLTRYASQRVLKRVMPPMSIFAPRMTYNLASLLRSVEVFDSAAHQYIPKSLRTIPASEFDRPPHKGSNGVSASGSSNGHGPGSATVSAVRSRRRNGMTGSGGGGSGGGKKSRDAQHSHGNGSSPPSTATAANGHSGGSAPDKCSHKQGHNGDDDVSESFVRLMWAPVVALERAYVRVVPHSVQQWLRPAWWVGSSVGGPDAVMRVFESHPGSMGTSTYKLGQALVPAGAGSGSSGEFKRRYELIVPVKLVSHFLAGLVASTAAPALMCAVGLR